MYHELKAEFENLDNDCAGQVGVLGGAIMAVGGIIGILVYAEVYAALNKDNIDAGTEAMLLIVPLVLGAVIVIGVLSTVMMIR